MFNVGVYSLPFIQLLLNERILLASSWPLESHCCMAPSELLAPFELQAPFELLTPFELQAPSELMALVELQAGAL